MSQKKINKAIELAIQYGQVDGGHHKMWVIDQMLRVLTKEKDYTEIIEKYCEDGNEWDCGIAP